MGQWLWRLPVRLFALTVPDAPEHAATAARERQRKARLLSIVIFSSLTLVLPFIAESFFYYPEQLPILFAFAAALGSAAWLNRRRALETSAVIFLVSYIAVTTTSLWVESPTITASFLWEWVELSLPALLAGLFLPFWAPFLFGAFDIVLLALIFVVRQQYGVTTQQLSSADHMDLLIYFFVITGGMAIIGALYAHSVERAVAQADHAAELAQSHSALEQAHHELATAYAKLEELATVDPITGLLNHRALHARLAAAIAHAKRAGESLAVVFADLDHFKHVNDTWGHPVGDSVLAHLAQCLRDALRAADTVARYGGEEFVMLLPDQDEPQARQTAERLRAQVAAMPARLDDDHTIAITLSIGVAVFPADGQTVATLLNAADGAMYRAKRAGRNRVCLAADLVVDEAA